ncbi:glycosyltransferase family 4 protein [Modestobacter sp. KNN46-3]|uniref:glycosyltransferase family 4 protein n=1 Tax=Modestobacter sp. KNN46-3 TaxID=2711218 RepID=UPI0019D22E61|nr:glycosyltransferase family 4 protein [Modestobacter sp. KNN46-3]
MHQHFRTPAMSGGTRSYEFARRLVAAGHQVSVVTARTASGRRSGSARWHRTTEQGIDVHWVDVPYDNSMRPWRRVLAFLQFMVASSRRAAGLPQDVVLGTSTPLTVAVPAAWAARRNRCRMVLEVRDLWPEVPIAMGVLRFWPARRAAELLERWAYHRADHVIALSPGMAAGVRAVDPDVPVTVIPNASDIDMFGTRTTADDELIQNRPWVATRPVLLYAGTFGRANGISWLVDVAAELRHRCPQAVVVLIGQGAEFEQTRRLAAELGLDDNSCIVLDSVPKPEVAAWFRACTVAFSCFVDVPALTANSANKFFDALAAGRPVAINHGGWLADVLQETGAGIVLSRDPGAAASSLSELLTDESRLSDARAAARMLAANDFNRDRLFASFQQVLTTTESSHAA